MPILTLAVMTMTAAQLLDLGTFIEMVHRVGLHAEANPVVATLIAGYGMPMAGIMKVTLIAFVAASTIVLSRKAGRFERGLGVAVIAAAIVAGLVGGGSNVLAIGGSVLAK